jgi:hypothetical protein
MRTRLRDLVVASILSRSHGNRPLVHYGHGRVREKHVQPNDGCECIQGVIHACFHTQTTQRTSRFYAALNKHNQLMLEAMQAHGCDRHFFALRCVAAEIGETKEHEM